MAKFVSVNYAESLNIVVCISWRNQGFVCFYLMKVKFKEDFYMRILGIIGKMIAATAIYSMMSSISLAQSSLPTDVQPTCPVSKTEFNSWFMAGKVTPDGRVKPADSVNFPTDNTVCDFYKWGAQMFLWLTSPESDGLVLDGSAIFNVLPADDQGVRYMVPNKDGMPIPMSVRREKFDDIGEVGQAGGGGVLMSQANSLVYYGVHVNNVYGYFLTGQKHNQFPGMNEFPHNHDDLDDVEKYVTANYSTPLYASEALVMELKTSWVEASSLPNAGDFIQMEATIPTFTPNSDNTLWTQNSTTNTTKLALVGMHVVGTVQNHPEFVWSTFEHISNVPDSDYYYYDKRKNLKKHAFSSDSNFVFMPKNGTQDNANTECMAFNNGNIVANKDSSGNPVCSGGVVPSKTYRINPWGSQSMASGKPDTASATNNTLLLSNNNSVIAQLANSDLRKNYIQIGGIWTSAPSDTADAPIPETAGYKSSDLRGSLILANSTMETYHQSMDCFACHQQSTTAPNSFQPFELSHIYSQISPLNLSCPLCLNGERMPKALMKK